MESHYETKNGYLVRCICPPRTENQQEIAALNFRRYVKLAAEIQRELEAKLDAFDTDPNLITMKERSNANLKS